MGKFGRIYALFVVGIFLGVCFSAAFPADTPEPEAEIETMEDMPELDHFKCYKATGQMTFNETVKLKDQFGEDYANVLYAYEFCTPVEKIHDGNVTPIKDPSAHLTMYLIQTPPVPDRNVIVSNQFGSDQPIKVSQPFALLVPTKKIGYPMPTGLDHYKCYEASGNTANAVVDLYDQFRFEGKVSVLVPFMLCAPVEKTHAGVVTPIQNPDAHLVCYLFKESPFYWSTYIQNQFTLPTWDYMMIGDSKALCVPSKKIEPEEEHKLDHFKCYYILSYGKLTKDVVFLSDQFGDSKALVDGARLFCNPVEKNHDGVITPISNPDAHLKMYNIQTYGRVQLTHGLAALNLPRQVVVSNQFGKFQELKVSRPVFLAVPTQKLPHDKPTDLDHFECYYVGGRPIYEMVNLKDQFKDERLVRVYNPILLCNPVVKTHHGKVTPVEHPEDHLVCYRIQTRPYIGYAKTDNQFGYETLLVRNSVILCVPSQKKVPAPDQPNIQQLCGDYDAIDFDGGMVLPGGDGTGLYRDNPDATWPEGRPRRPCGEYVPIDGYLPPAGVERFRVVYRPAGDPIPAPGDPATLYIHTMWKLRDRNPGPFCAVNDAHTLQTDGNGWIDASDYLEAKNGGPSTDGCTNSGMRLAVWNTLSAPDPNGHYVVWLEWQVGGVSHREPFEHHIQLDNTLPVINDLDLRLEDCVTPIGPCGGTGPINGTLKVFADFEDDYYWGYLLRVRGGNPPDEQYYGWHYYHEGTAYVANTDTTGTVPDATTVFLRDIDLNDLDNFIDCCYVLDLWVRDSAIRHSFNNQYANDISGSSGFWDNEFLTFAAMPEGP